MGDRYKVSKELGREKPVEDPLPKEEVTTASKVLNTQVEGLNVDANIYWLTDFIGSSKEMLMIKSDIGDQINKLQDLTDKAVVGLMIMSDGSVGLSLET